MANMSSRPPGRRQFARFPVSYAALLRDERFPDRKVSGMVRDIGDGGLMVELPVQLPSGGDMGLLLQTQRGPLPVEGQVVWAAATKDMIRYGIAFPEPKDMGFALDLFLTEGGKGRPFPPPNPL